MRRTLLCASIAMTIVAGAGGCYNGEEMVARVLQREADDHRSEIEIGVYQVTLPRPADDPVATTLHLEVVATVHRHDARAVKQQLARVEAPLRHAVVLALRQASPEELLDADLTALHERIAAATAEILTAAPIESVAFRSFAVYED